MWFVIDATNVKLIDVRRLSTKILRRYLQISMLLYRSLEKYRLGQIDSDPSQGYLLLTLIDRSLWLSVTVHQIA